MNTNEILKNPGFGFIEAISDITTQYFKKMELHFFGHVKVYRDGKFSFLCTTHGWPEKILAEERLPPVGYTFYDHITDRVTFPSMDKNNIFGWDDKVTLESKERFGIQNPMMITRKYEDHFEGFVFDLQGEDAYEKYLNHFDVFENFIHYHKDKSRKIIQKVNQNPLHVENQYLLSPQKNLMLPNRKGTEVLAPQLKRYYLRHKNKDIVVSAKEYYCLSLLAHGKPLKRIAQKLGLSLRTVETYFERIKKKLGLSTRLELTRVYWDNRILSE